jgi:hypothetical protein
MALAKIASATKIKINMSKPKFLIGIDPDVDRSGYAAITGDQLTLDNLNFFQLFEKLKYFVECQNKPIVYIECGFLNKSNWHNKSDRSAAFNSKIGERTGANFETAKKIIEMCEYLQISYVKIKPTARKTTNDYFKSLTGHKGVTNQEQRDAFMLIFGR